MQGSRKVIVAGGSLGGLLAANILVRAGWDVHVYEKAAEDLEGRGAGIVTHEELFDALEVAGITPDDSLGVRVTDRVTLARDGSRVATRPMPQVLTAWGRLYQLLKNAFPADRYHNGYRLESLVQDETKVRVRFAGGREAEAEFLVAADGIRSTVRQVMLPDVQPKYAGYVAWRGLVEERDLSARALEEVFPYFGFCLPPREQMLGYPVAGGSNDVRAGHRRYNFVWYRPVDEQTDLRELLKDANGKVWLEGIPPPLIRPQILAVVRKEAHRVLAPQFAEIVDKTRQLFFQPIFDLESPTLAMGRVALLGDAAFVARPHCGMGVTKAAGDAVALVDAISKEPDITSALRRYEAARVEFGRFIVGHARALGAYMQARLLTEQEREMAERYRTPQAVMDETAVSPAAH